MPDLNDLALHDLFATLCAGAALDALLDAALAEDLGNAGDLTTRSIVDPDARAAGIVVARAPGIVAGGPVIPHLLRRAGVEDQLDARLLVNDGEACAAGTAVARLKGRLGPMLTVERTLLNLLGHLCGVATLTRRFVEAVAGTGAQICDTRKTLPGLRPLEKYAVRCGGGIMHRQGLFDALLYKDNHLAAVPRDELAPRLADAIRSVRGRHDLRFAEVEVDTLEQLRAVLQIEPGLVDIVLLDNMDPADLRRAVAACAEAGSPVRLEASGGVTLESVRAIAASGVHRIAVGAITHSAPALDLGLDIEP